MKTHLKNIIIDYIIISILGITIFLLAGNCSQTRPHDPAVIESLKNLKTKTLTFYDTFLDEKIDEFQRTEINSDFDKLISDEKKRTDHSSEYINQVTITKRMFNRHCHVRKKSKISEQMLNYFKRNISDAFDAMISTENHRKKTIRS